MENSKQKLIDDFTRLSKGKSTEEILPLMLAVLNKAKQNNITITKNEAKEMIDNLMADAPSEKRQQIGNFLEFLTQI